jgi:hypothetical protein
MMIQVNTQVPLDYIQQHGALRVLSEATWLLVHRLGRGADGQDEKRPYAITESWDSKPGCVKRRVREAINITEPKSL